LQNLLVTNFLYDSAVSYGDDWMFAVHVKEKVMTITLEGVEWNFEPQEELRMFFKAVLKRVKELL